MTGYKQLEQKTMKTLLVTMTLLLVCSFSHASIATTLQQAQPDELYTAKTEPELYCMATNIYFEARAESLAGQFAVADVTLNRVNDKRYPDSVCAVVMDAKMKESWKTKQFLNLHDSERVYIPIRNKCQFSWYCDGKADKVHDNDSWRRAQTVAYMIMINRKYRGITEGATHYHADYVSPKWAPELDLVGRIGVHVFYRWP